MCYTKIQMQRHQSPRITQRETGKGVEGYPKASVRRDIGRWADGSQRVQSQSISPSQIPKRWCILIWGTLLICPPYASSESGWKWDHAWGSLNEVLLWNTGPSLSGNSPPPCGAPSLQYTPDAAGAAWGAPVDSFQNVDLVLTTCTNSYFSGKPQSSVPHSI